ncbi:hypothetical protein ACM66B_005508 [Microbotryomycetes sp. NB124-2]
MPPKGSTTGKRRSTSSAKTTSSKQPQQTQQQAKMSNKGGQSLTRTFSATKQQLTTSDGTKAKAGVETSAGEEDEMRELVRKCSSIIKRAKKEMGPPSECLDWDDLVVVLRVFDANPDFGPCSHQS